MIIFAPQVYVRPNHGLSCEACGLSLRDVRSSVRMVTVTLATVVSVLGCDASEQSPSFTTLEVPVRHAEPLIREPSDYSDLQPVTLQLQKRLGDSLPFGKVQQVLPWNELLVVLDPLVSPHVVLLDPSTDVVRTRVGRQGEGPGEIRFPSWVIPDSEEPEVVWLFDHLTRRFTRFSLGQPGGLIPSNELIRLSSALAPARPVFGPDGILSNGYFPDQALMMWDSLGTPRGFLTVGPSNPRDGVPLVGQIRLNRSHLAVSHESGRIALAYQAESRLDIFTLSGEYLTTTLGPRKTESSYRVDEVNGRSVFRWNEDNDIAYVDATASHLYVYTLFCGPCVREGDLARLIHVWGWDGELVAELELDRGVLNIAVTPDGQLLFGAYDDPEPYIGVWALPVLR